MTAVMPEQRLRDEADNTGACLAYDAAHGWHLAPEPELLEAVRKQRPLHLRLAETPPPAAVDELDAWVRRTNHQLLLDQGYSPQHADRMTTTSQERP